MMNKMSLSLSVSDSNNEYNSLTHTLPMSQYLQNNAYNLFSTDQKAAKCNNFCESNHTESLRMQVQYYRTSYYLDTNHH